MADWKQRALDAERRLDFAWQEAARNLELAETMDIRVKEATRRANILEQAFKDVYWMARRYADGRKTYAPSMYNAAVDRVLALGITLQLDPCEGGNKLYASDGDDR